MTAAARRPPDARVAVVIGRGRVGRALAAALRRAGWRVEARAGRAARARRVPPSATVVVAVPDAAVAGVAARLRPAVAEAAALLHVAGALPPEALAGSGLAPSRLGAMHPLVSFADRRSPPRLGGAAFVCAGGPRAVAAAHRVARAVGARPIQAPRGADAPEARAAYHAAAALAANGAATLAAHAVDVLEGLGFARPDAERAVGALLGTVAENVARVGLPGALTGPVRRGDAETVRRHRAALAARAPAAAAAYDAVAPATLALARAAGLAPGDARAVAAALRAPTPTPAPTRRRARAPG